MKVLLARYTVKKGKTKEVLDYLRVMAEKVNECEPGCRVYSVHQSTEQAESIVLYEVYEDDTALEEHRNTPHFKEIIEGKVIPLLEKREREFYNLLPF
ncbi:putative quinol monooxygenase [Ammoniphilus sp. YIM 78166]|uniref:putative quinol monooxygenase n=1 Tax=Ammoniphilus sp. YIM 78166 TaxID=1644106 RepID=UPI00106F49D3|nr:putative quinol monooxygenase [Ammoniphilus sp. YIM 78166]